MIRAIFLFVLIMISAKLVFSTQISGTVKEKSGEGIPGVNVYVKGTYDGATTNLSGEFMFESSEKGKQTIIFSFIGFKTQEQLVDISFPVNLDITLTEEISKLNGVVITAGAFEASDESKSVVFKPLDIATTAGATADIVGALNTLPGTTTNGETGRLFVRGGTAEETKAFINGMMVSNFYSASRL